MKPIIIFGTVFLLMVSIASALSFKDVSTVQLSYDVYDQCTICSWTGLGTYTFNPEINNSINVSGYIYASKIAIGDAPTDTTAGIEIVNTTDQSTSKIKISGSVNPAIISGATKAFSQFRLDNLFSGDYFLFTGRAVKSNSASEVIQSLYDASSSTFLQTFLINSRTRELRFGGGSYIKTLNMYGNHTYIYAKNTTFRNYYGGKNDVTIEGNLNITGTTSKARLSYNKTRYVDMYTDSNGYMTVDPVGDRFTWKMSSGDFQLTNYFFYTPSSYAFRSLSGYMAFSADGSGAGNDIYFKAGGYTNTRMTILGLNGNVGIGDGSPSYKLEVNGTENTYGYFVNNTKGESKTITFENGTSVHNCTIIFKGGLYTGGTC